MEAKLEKLRPFVIGILTTMATVFMAGLSSMVYVNSTYAQKQWVMERELSIREILIEIREQGRRTEARMDQILVSPPRGPANRRGN